MSERRTILSRPRTKVYESNYNIGQSYYKPMMDQLDRKYSGRPLLPPSPPRDFSSSRRALDEEFSRDKDFASRTRDAREDFLDRASNAQKETDAFFDRHGRRTEADHLLDRPSPRHKSDTQDFFDKAVSKAEESFAEKSSSFRSKADSLVEKAMSRATLDDEDDIIAAQLKRVKARRAEQAAARDNEDLEFTLNGIKSKRSSALYR